MICWESEVPCSVKHALITSLRRPNLEPSGKEEAPGNLCVETRSWVCFPIYGITGFLSDFDYLPLFQALCSEYLPLNVVRWNPPQINHDLSTNQLLPDKAAAVRSFQILLPSSLESLSERWLPLSSPNPSTIRLLYFQAHRFCFAPSLLGCICRGVRSKFSALWTGLAMLRGDTHRLATVSFASFPSSGVLSLKSVKNVRCTFIYNFF